MPSACPRPVRLESEIAAMLGAPLASARALRADVAVAQQAELYRLTLRVEDAEGRAERDVALRSCAEVERAVVLLVTTALQMDAVAPTPPDVTEPPFEPVEVPVAPVEPVLTATPIVREQPPRAPSWLLPREPPSWWLRLGAGLDVASLPSATAGLFVGVGMHLRPWRVWIDGRYLLPREHVDPASAQPAEIGLFAAALGGSLALALRRLSLGPALELELGAQRARVLGEHADGSTHTAWVAVLCGGHADLALRSGVALALDVLLGIPLRRPSFAVDDQPFFYRTGALTGRIVLGVQVHLGP